MTGHLTQGHKKAQKAQKSIRNTPVHFVTDCGYTARHAEEKSRG
jgi:hypothetical protein